MDARFYKMGTLNPKIGLKILFFGFLVDKKPIFLLFLNELLGSYPHSNPVLADYSFRRIKESLPFSGLLALVQGNNVSTLFDFIQIIRPDLHHELTVL
ncbi:MAG: hypothetical protein G3I10_06335 [Ferrovum sp.]|nr:hypothetical protein [Ferrovum sp.]